LRKSTSVWLAKLRNNDSASNRRGSRPLNAKSNDNKKRQIELDAPQSERHGKLGKKNANKQSFKRGRKLRLA
jgi:hypothetical protein